MSTKRWADQDSSDDSDEGSVEGESDNEAPPKTIGASKAPLSVNAPHARNTAAPVPRTECHIAYISNLNGTASRMDVGRFFEDKKCRIVNLDLHAGPNKPSSATMEFKDAESLSIALSLNGDLFLGLPIRTKVFEVRGHPQGQAHRQQQQQPQGQGRGGGGYRDAPRGNRNEEDRFPGRRQDSGRGDGGRGRGGSSRERLPPTAREASPVPTAAAVPATRPKLNLAPRTLPVELIGKAPVETKPDIFGGGKPHDEVVYEEKKKTIVEPKEGNVSVEKASAAVAVPNSVFALDALKEALPPAAEEQQQGQQDAPTAQAQSGENPNAHPGRQGGRGSSGGRGAAAGGRDSGTWSREASSNSTGRNSTKGGRGGAATGRGQGNGAPGRTVEVTPTAGGSYLIEKPSSSEGTGTTEGVAPRGVRPPREHREPREESAGRVYGNSKHQSGGRGAPTSAGTGGGRGARERDRERDREPRQPRGPGGGAHTAADTASTAAASTTGVTSGEFQSGGKEEGGAATSSGAGHSNSRPKSGGAAGSKLLFSKAMDQASSGSGGASKVSKKTAVAGAGSSAAAGPVLTEEEKFHKAQEKIAASSSFSSSTGSNAAVAAKKKPSSVFAALLSDSEDE